MRRKSPKKSQMDKNDEEDPGETAEDIAKYSAESGSSAISPSRHGTY